MALREEYAIRGAIEGKPYPHAPSIFIAYPNRADWRHLYDPQPLRMPDDNGIYRNTNAFEARYQDMKRHHENKVSEQLDLIRRLATGRAVLAELAARGEFSVNIFPFDFLPTSDWSISTRAVTEPVAVMQTAEERAHHRRPLGTKLCIEGACFADGVATSADMFYTPSHGHGTKRPDDVLLHELVHATRFVRGVLDNDMKVSAGYGNQEEFFANTIQMIYRSEQRKGLPLIDYAFHQIDPATFLDRSVMPPPALLLGILQRQQRSLFDALAKVDAVFNPIRQVDALIKAQAARIERTT